VLGLVPPDPGFIGDFGELGQEDRWRCGFAKRVTEESAEVMEERLESRYEALHRDRNAKSEIVSAPSEAAEITGNAAVSMTGELSSQSTAHSNRAHRRLQKMPPKQRPRLQ
jgi:hypothetical protein